MSDHADKTAIDAFLHTHTAWTYADNALHTTRTFDTFMAAIDALNAIAQKAEEADHHPDLFNSYTTVKITLTSHDAAAVTTRDLALATAIDTVLAG